MIIYNIAESAIRKPINLELSQVVGVVKVTSKLTRVAVMPSRGFVVDRNEFIGYHLTRGGESVNVPIYPECTNVIFTDEDDNEEVLRICIYVGDIKEDQMDEKFQWVIFGSARTDEHYLVERDVDLSTRDKRLLADTFQRASDKLILSSTYEDLTRYYMNSGIILTCGIHIGNGQIGNATTCLIVDGEDSVEVFITPQRPNLQCAASVRIGKYNLYVNFLGVCENYLVDEIVDQVTRKFESEAGLVARDMFDNIQLGWAWKSNEEMLLSGKFVAMEDGMHGSTVPLTDELSVFAACAYYYHKGHRYILTGTRVIGVDDADLFMDKVEEGDVSIMHMLDTFVDTTCRFFPAVHEPKELLRATLEAHKSVLTQNNDDYEEPEE